MTVKIISRKLDAREITVKLVDGSIVRGKVNLYHDEGNLQRVSELFTQVKEPFIVVFDATVEAKSGKVVIINKNNISWVSPEEGSVAL